MDLKRRIAQFEKVPKGAFLDTMNTLKSQLVAAGARLENDEDAFSKAYSLIRCPRRATADSAGYDFICPVDLTLQYGQSVVIPTGIRCRIETGWVLMIYPRSGLGFKYRVGLDNTVGVIDGDYYHTDNYGHIMIKIHNDAERRQPVSLAAGSYFAQGIFQIYGITYADSVTANRVGGFGSTS